MKGKSVLWEVLEWVVWLGVAFVIAWVLNTFVIGLVQVQGQSMEPTLHENDKLFVYKLWYEPKDGDIVSFKPVNDKDLYIKRVIAVAGEEIDIDTEKAEIYVDGKLLKEDYIKEAVLNKVYWQDMKFPQVVPEGCVFVMGDNRNNSKDSRTLEVGFVEKKAIVGRAVFRFSPIVRAGSI